MFQQCVGDGPCLGVYLVFEPPPFGTVPFELDSGARLRRRCSAARRLFREFLLDRRVPVHLGAQPVHCLRPAGKQAVVKAGGGSCPIRFQCSGCGFYRPDPSYLPVIEDHIRSLKADRETAAAMDVDTYVLRNLDDQIESYRHVLGGMKEHLDALPEDERQEVEQAGILLRRIRAGGGGHTQLPLTVKTGTHPS